MGARTSCRLSCPYSTSPFGHSCTIDQAKAVGADCIVVACPLCHANLDGRQLQMKDLEEKMPVLYLTQLMSLAFGVDPKEAGLHKNLVDPFPLLQERGLVV